MAIRSFGKFAPLYDSFRQGGLFFKDFELALGRIFLRLGAKNLVAPKIRSLELGCGTGIWCRELAAILCEADINGAVTGIDKSANMLSVAKQTTQRSEIRFVKADCRELGRSLILGKQDLVFAPMSADYIGAEATARALRACLAPGGLALLWFFDPSRYQSVGDFRVKRWQFAEHQIEMAVRYFDVDVLLSGLRREGLECTWFLFDVPTLDGVARRMWFLSVSKSRSNLLSLDVVRKVANGYSLLRSSESISGVDYVTA